MKSLTRGLCGLVLCVALWGAPVVQAEEAAAGAGSWLQALMQVIEEIILGAPPEGDATLGDPTPPKPEIGDLYPPGG